MTAPVGLGGPGVACSALRVRRLDAGELSGEELLRTEAHVAGCERCQAVRRQIEAEREALHRHLPFPAFAAGIAGRLAGSAQAPGGWRRRWVPLALAAGLAAVVVTPIVRPSLLGRGDVLPGVRTKGAASVQVQVATPAGPRTLAAGEPVPSGAAMRIVLAPGDRREAAVALVDRDGPALLYAGPAPAGPVPGAFEWTGEGDGELVVVLDDRPVDGAALLQRLRDQGLGGAVPGRGAELVVVPLTRSAR